MNSNFSNVSSGQSWSPEPAQRYNAVNELLSQFGYSGSNKGKSGFVNRAAYHAVNRDSGVIGAGIAVEPSAAALENSGLVPVKISKPGTSALWGVSTGSVEPGKTGSVQLTGVITVQLASALPAGTKYVAPGAGGKFIAASSGRAQVIAAKDLTATVILGAGGESRYSGFFVLKAADEPEEQNATPKIKVTDGTGTLGGNAGIYVSGINLIYVPETILDVKTAGFVILEASYENEEWTIEISISGNLPAFTADKFTAVLGYVMITDKKLSAIHQIWNNGILYNNRYS